MNTLNKTITLSLLGEGGYEALRARWSELCSSDERKNLTRTHHLLYAVLMGRDWRKGFCRKDADGNYTLPYTNAKKIENGANWNWGARHAAYEIGVTYPKTLAATLKPFEGLITAETLCLVSKLLPKPHFSTTLPCDVAYPGAPIAEVKD